MPLQIGKTPIVVPRQHQYNEHVNDHQVEFARNVAQRMGTIIPVEDINTLGDIITNYRRPFGLYAVYRQEVRRPRSDPAQLVSKEEKAAETGNRYPGLHLQQGGKFMTETIQIAMDRLMTISAESQDYVAEDGLLYCGSCKTPKEAFFPNGKKLFGRDRHPAECRCRQATREKQEKEERARLHYEKVQRLKLQGFTDWAMQHWTFANDHGQNPQMQLAQRYVAHWPEMRDKNVGLLLWGGVGTGKSFMAGCIANALMEQEVAVCMTNFARIMNELNSTFAGRNEVVDRLCSYPLLVIDDFGMERGTEYALEQIYNIIDSRYRSRKPLIVTTNLTLTELKKPQDTAHARIYDRLLELCTPIACTGPSMRKDIGQAKLNLLKTLLA